MMYPISIPDKAEDKLVCPNSRLGPYLLLATEDSALNDPECDIVINFPIHTRLLNKRPPVHKMRHLKSRDKVLSFHIFHTQSLNGPILRPLTQAISQSDDHFTVQSHFCFNFADPKPRPQLLIFPRL